MLVQRVARRCHRACTQGGSRMRRSGCWARRVQLCTNHSTPFSTVVQSSYVIPLYVKGRVQFCKPLENPRYEMRNGGATARTNSRRALSAVARTREEGGVGTIPPWSANTACRLIQSSTRPDARPCTSARIVRPTNQATAPAAAAAACRRRCQPPYWHKRRTSRAVFLEIGCL